MGFPASTAIPSEALPALRARAGELKGFLQSQSALLQSASSWERIKLLHRGLTAYIRDIARLAATPGLADYAKEAYADIGIDIVGTYTVMADATVAARDAIETSIDAFQGAGGKLEDFDAEHNIVPAEFQPAALADLRAALDAAAQSID
jgi:hypothetical protein